MGRINTIVVLIAILAMIIAICNASPTQIGENIPREKRYAVRELMNQYPDQVKLHRAIRGICGWCQCCARGNCCKGAGPFTCSCCSCG
jgi:hypothetical protein